VTVDGREAGLIALADALKPGTAAAITALQRLDFRVHMVSGDRTAAARAVAQQLGLDGFHAEVTPARKQELVRQHQARGERVVFAGDGLNDAPALAAADVGIAMGTGTDVAMHSAGLVLVKGDLAALVRAVHLSRAVMRNIRQNLFWAFAYNVAGLPLAAGALFPFTGWLLSPMFAGAAMSLSSISVVANALRLRRLKL
jgi:Cu+-exporting ATPase